MNVREKVVIGSRSKKYQVCQVVAMTNLTIAGCLTRAFLSVKQQVFFGLHMKKARECSVFYVRNTTLKTKRTNPKRIMQLQECASKIGNQRTFCISTTQRCHWGRDGLFGAFFFLAAHNNSRRVILDHANSQQHFQFPTQYSIYLWLPLAGDLLGIQQDAFCPLFSVGEPKLAVLPAISRFS